MPQEHALDVPDASGHLSSGLSYGSDLANRQVVGGAPIGIQVPQFPDQEEEDRGSWFKISRTLSSLRTRRTDLAIIRSSSVGMTLTLTPLASDEISAAFVALRCRFRSRPRKPSPSQDSFADDGRVLADATREDESVQSTDGGEGTRSFLRLVAEQRHRFRRPRVAAFLRQQLAQVGVDPGDTRQPGFVADHPLKAGRSHALGAGQVVDQAGIQVAGAGAR